VTAKQQVIKITDQPEEGPDGYEGKNFEQGFKMRVEMSTTGRGSERKLGNH